MAVGESLPSAPRPAPAAAPAPTEARLPATLAELVELAQTRGDARLRAEIVLYVRPVRVEAGRLEFSTAPGAPSDLAGRLSTRLREWTLRPWAVVVSTEPGEPSIAEREAQAKAAARAEVERHPLVQSVLTAFPGATIQRITPPPVSGAAENESDNETGDMPPEPIEAEDEP
jgi:DNA polymerase-3 subunit gamma/tau